MRPLARPRVDKRAVSALKLLSIECECRKPLLLIAIPDKPACIKPDDEELQIFRENDGPLLQLDLREQVLCHRLNPSIPDPAVRQPFVNMYCTVVFLLDDQSPRIAFKVIISILPTVGNQWSSADWRPPRHFFADLQS